MSIVSKDIEYNHPTDALTLRITVTAKRPLESNVTSSIFSWFIPGRRRFQIGSDGFL